MTAVDACEVPNLISEISCCFGYDLLM